MANKSKNLIPLIIDAKDVDEAISVLKEVMDNLYITEDYVEIMRITDRLNEMKADYNVLTNKIKTMEKTTENILNMRMELTFFYRDVTNEFSFDVNKAKIFEEEFKTAERGKALTRLSDNKGVLEQFNMKKPSASTLRDILGLDDEYSEYIHRLSQSYGNYKTLESFLISIRDFINLMSSMQRGGEEKPMNRVADILDKMSEQFKIFTNKLKL